MFSRNPLVTSVLLMLAPTLAHAQGADNPSDRKQLEELVVTAQRQEQVLQDVPISMNAISANSLAAKGIDSVTALSAVVPALNVPMVGSVASPYLRGIGSNAADPNNEPSVALYVDGIYMAAPFANLFSFNNIERVEVLKGPQGTLFGRNATGGVIQIITREPSFEPLLETAIGYGNYKTGKVDLYGSSGITDTVAMDLAVQYEEQGEGWGNNVLTGKDVYKTRQNSVRSKLLFTPGGDTRVVVSVDHSSRTSSVGDYQLGPGIVGLDGGTHWHGRYDTETNYPYQVEAETQGASVRIEQALGDIELISMTAYRENDGDYDFDSDATPADFVTALLHQEASNFSQEFQLVGSGDSYDWLLGAFYFDSSAEYHPGRLSGLAFGGGTIDLFGKQETESWSLYGQSTFELADRLSATLGLRYTDEEQKFISGVGSASVPDVEKGFDKFTWRAALDYKVTDDVMTYASYNRGIKSGGFDILSPGNRGYAPEILDAYEIGVKSELLDNTLRLNAALFYYDYQDMQVTSIQQNTTNTANAASATIKGAEFDLEAALTNTLTLSAGLAWMDGQYDDFPNPVVYPASPSQPAVVLPNAKGNATIRTPEWTGHVGLDYSQDVSFGQIKASLNVSYNDGYYWAPDERFAQDAYTLVNASVGWQTRDERIGVTLWCENLTDEEYLMQGVPSANGDLRVYAPPRTYGIKLTNKF